VLIPVWVDDWQQECCGQDLAVGRRVSWTLVAADESVSGVLGAAYPSWSAEGAVEPTIVDTEHYQARVVRSGALAVLVPADQVSSSRRTLRMPAEEHHSDLGQAPPTSGTVRRVQVVLCAFELSPEGGNVYVAVPGSATLADVPSWEDGPRPGPGEPLRQRWGYVVQLELDGR
jgi:hypothetical protein